MSLAYNPNGDAGPSDIPMTVVGSAPVGVEAGEPESTLPPTSIPALECRRPIKFLGIQEETPLAWSCDGRRLAFVSGNHAVYVVELEEASGRFVVTGELVGHAHEVRTLAFNPVHPSILASCGPDGVYVWDVERESTVMVISEDTRGADAHEADVEIVMWIFGGDVLVSGSRDTNVKFWHAASPDFALLETVTSHKEAVLSLAFCPATETLATSGRDAQVKLWDVSTLSAAGRTAREDDSTIKTQLLLAMDGHRGDVTTMVFATDGSFIYTGARDNEIKVWSTTTGNELRSVLGHKGDIRRISLLNGETLSLTASNDSTVKLWRLPEARPAEVATELADISADFLVDLPASVTVDDLLEPGRNSDELLASFNAHTASMFDMALNGQAPFLATSSCNCVVRIWSIADLMNPVVVSDFVGHRQAITEVVMLAGDTRFVSCSLDYNVFVYDIDQLKRLASYNFGGSVNSMAQATGTDMVFCGGTQYDIKGYSVGSQFSHLVTLSGHAGRVEALAVHPSQTLVASSGHDFDIFLWRLDPRSFNGAREPVLVTPSSTVEAHQGHITQLDFSDDGKLLASAGTDHAVMIFKVSNGKKLKLKWAAERAHDAVVSSVVFGTGPTAAVAASASWDKTVKLWDTSASKTPTPFATLVHRSKVTDVSFAAGGTLLIASTSVFEIRCWAVASPFNCVAVYIVPSSEGQFTCISGGDAAFISGSEHGMLRVWPLPVGDAVDRYFHPHAAPTPTLQPL